jgi:hypothetical protein
MSRLLRQALDALNEQIAKGLEYPDAHTFVVTTFGLTDQEAADLAQAYDTQDQKRGVA